MKKTNRAKRLAVLALMAAMGLNLASCEDIPIGMGKITPISEIKVTVTVDGDASKDGSTTANVGLTMNKDPGSGAYYVIENLTPDVCQIDPAQIDIDNWQNSQNLVVSGLDNGVAGDQECRFIVTLFDKDGNPRTSEPGVVIVVDPGTDLPDIKLTVKVDGNASEDGRVTADVGLTMSRDPESDTYYVVENHTPDVCNIEPMHIDVDRDDWDDTQHLTVSGIPNGIVTGELECRFTVTLYDKDGKVVASEDGVVIVEDEDSPGLHAIGSSKYTSEDGTSVTFDVSLYTQPSDTVTVIIKSSDITEGVLVDADGNPVEELVLIFTPDNWNVPQTITVQGVPDGIVDGDKDYHINFEVVSDDENYNGYKTTRPLVNIDIDKPGLWVEGDITSIIVSESGTSVDLPIFLTAEPACDVTVHIVSSNTAEAAVSPSTLTFGPGNWNVTQIATVTGVPDDIDDGDQLFTITISASGCFYDSAEHYIVHGINENIDTAGIVVTKESDIIIVSEDGLTSVVELVLTSKPTAPVTITFTVDDTNVATTHDVGPISVVIYELTFTPDNWDVPQVFVVHGVDNDIVDGHRPFVIDLVATSDDPKYDHAFIEPIHGICLDDDSPADVHVHPWTVYITSDALTATFTVVLTKAPGEDLTFPISLEAIGIAAGFEIDKTEVHFSSIEWYKPQVVTVSIAAEIPNSFGNFFIEIGKDPAATAIYQDLDPHDVVVLYDFRNPCSEPTVLGAGTYKLEAWGAQGGVTFHYPSDINRGGYASGILTLTEETKVWRCEGGKGQDGNYVDRIVQGGKNGGGNGGYANYMGDDNAGGGGGSDVRIGMNTFYHRVIVAGGAGGNGCGSAGGVGGGLNGLDGIMGPYRPSGLGGTQTEGGASVGKPEIPNTFSQAGGFGYGGAGSAFEANYGSGGGGGGWFGGSGGNNDPGGGDPGGGGSGYVLTETSDKPAGYALGSQYFLTDTVLLHGREVMSAPAGGTQTGQLGDGVVRISKCDSDGDNCVECLDGICPE